MAIWKARFRVTAAGRSPASDRLHLAAGSGSWQPVDGRTKGQLLTQQTDVQHLRKTQLPSGRELVETMPKQSYVAHRSAGGATTTKSYPSQRHAAKCQRERPADALGVLATT